MALDPAVSAAIEAAVAASRQPKELAKRIEAFLNQISAGNASLDKPDDIKKPMERILAAVKVRISEEE